MKANPRKSSKTTCQIIAQLWMNASKIMKIMADEVNEVKGNTKIKFIEGERVFKIEG